MRNMLGITNEFYRSVYRDLIGKPAFGLVPVLLRPNSRGRISLKSRNPFHWPRMDPNFFQNQTDVETLIKGVRAVVSMPLCVNTFVQAEIFDGNLNFSVFERSEHGEFCQMEDPFQYSTIFGLWTLHIRFGRLLGVLYPKTCWQFTASGEINVCESMIQSHN